MTRNPLMLKTLRHSRAALIGMAAGLAVTTSAQAQTAAGTGRGLEKDLRVGGTGNTPRPDFGAEIRLRNSLVTGNAAGGKALRITAPYSDPADFRDTLGSSDIFAFRRDSLYSGLGGRGYRGTEGLQYQFGWSTGGSTVGLTISTLDSNAPRVATGLTSSSTTGSTRYSSKSWDIAAPVTGAMRSTAAFSSTRSLTPTAVGVRQLDDGRRELVAASSLLGLRGIEIEKREAWNEPYGVVKTREQQAALGDVRVAKPETTPPKNPLAAQPADGHFDASAKAKAAGTAATRSAYDDLRARLNDMGEELNKAEKKTDKKGDTKTDTKGPDGKAPSKDTPGAGTTTPGPSTESPDGPTVPNAWDSRMDSLRKTLGSAEQSKEGGGSSQALDPSTLRAIREAGQTSRVTKVVPLGQTNIFAEHIEAGERLMGEEKYFDAEERFTRAITVRPGDANALAGRINAQLGSGLFVSAAVNLRTLAVTKPDAIGMLFADNLLPSKKRQQQLLAQLRTNLALDNKPELRVPKESALLLAYLGYQRSEPATVREGLAAFRKIASPEEMTLLTFLEGVWVGNDASK